MNYLFDLRFENELIKEYAEDIYEECKNVAERRMLERDYVIEKFLKNFSALARRDGYIK